HGRHRLARTAVVALRDPDAAVPVPLLDLPAGKSVVAGRNLRLTAAAGDEQEPIPGGQQQPEARVAGAQDRQGSRCGAGSKAAAIGPDLKIAPPAVELEPASAWTELQTCKLPLVEPSVSVHVDQKEVAGFLMFVALEQVVVSPVRIVIHQSNGIAAFAQPTLA